MKIGGTARYYAELKIKSDVEEAYQFSQEKDLPLIPLGGGSNTIFADGLIDAIIVSIKEKDLPNSIEALSESIGDPHRHVLSTVFGVPNGGEHRVKVSAGKYLASLINDQMKKGLDFSPLTGIPGTLGGAIFGNAGQGFDGVWLSNYIYSVSAFINGKWELFSKEECKFGYRTSVFKNIRSPIIWECTLTAPSHPTEEIKTEVERLLKKRIETQPHIKTAGSCFLSKSKEEPAWKLIDAVGLRGLRVGGIEISQKHANFLINTGNATFEDAEKLVRHVQSAVPQDLRVEMRFIEENGSLGF